MKFYKGKKEVYDYNTGYALVKSELLTERERRKFFPSLSGNCFEETEVSKKGTYWMFGARFAL